MKKQVLAVCIILFTISPIINVYASSELTNAQNEATYAISFHNATIEAMDLGDKAYQLDTVLYVSDIILMISDSDQRLSCAFFFDVSSSNIKYFLLSTSNIKYVYPHMASSLTLLMSAFDSNVTEDDTFSTQFSEAILGMLSKEDVFSFAIRNYTFLVSREDETYSVMVYFPNF